MHLQRSFAQTGSATPPDVLLRRSFTRPSVLAVIEGLGTRLQTTYFQSKRRRATWSLNAKSVCRVSLSGIGVGSRTHEQGIVETRFSFSHLTSIHDILHVLRQLLQRFSGWLANFVLRCACLNIWSMRAARVLNLRQSVL